MRLLRLPLVLAALAAAVGLALAAARPMPKLPADFDLPRSADSPGPVAFRHGTHVDGDRPDCVACHPVLFPILGSERVGRTPLKHDDMKSGKSCGACHDGKTAHGFDDCTSCHRDA